MRSMAKFHTALNNLLTQPLQLNTALAWIDGVGIVQRDKNAHRSQYQNQPILLVNLDWKYELFYVPRTSTGVV